MFAPTHSKSTIPGLGGWDTTKTVSLTLSGLQKVRRADDVQTDEQTDGVTDCSTLALATLFVTQLTLSKTSPPPFCGLAFISLAPLHLLELEALCRFRDNGTSNSSHSLSHSRDY